MKNTAKFFRDLQPGAPFRFQVPSILKGKTKWIYGQFAHIKDGKAMWSYWDHRHDYVIKWDKKDAAHTLEPWTPSITDEDLAIPVYLETVRDEYVLSPWTLGELEGSSWSNHYTHDVVSGCVVDYDRFGKLHLYYSDRDSFETFNNLTMWYDINKTGGWNDLLIAHWQRYDIMTPDEQIERARQKVSYQAQETRSTRYNGGPPPNAQQELEKAKRFLQELSGATQVTPDILNVGTRPGDQLSLL